MSTPRRVAKPFPLFKSQISPRSCRNFGLDDPRRVGKTLGAELAGIYSARLGREWRVLYEIDDGKQLVIVLDIRPRSVAYRRH